MKKERTLTLKEVAKLTGNKGLGSVRILRDAVGLPRPNFN